MTVIGGNQRDAGFCREFDQRAIDLVLDLAGIVSLHLEIEIVLAKDVLVFERKLPG